MPKKTILVKITFDVPAKSKYSVRDYPYQTDEELWRAWLSYSNVKKIATVELLKKEAKEVRTEKLKKLKQ